MPSTPRTSTLAHLAVLPLACRSPERQRRFSTASPFLNRLAAAVVRISGPTEA
ncbi:uncharacterized protein SCHCODRAFT_01174207 [Schizophyllum commune H4-8]|uniref:uncharacterized protein n=1 Tax=Schizophyllum commune (strain H4-8 / FGSC 9210) TaxID=578458 RepID=UPI00215F128A|nr:uncharacterized protein SCHCODRAFT_01174207 [Schizophyllum commune H4-8]KAI5888142.1 hypothetical protein SCHCODRAFT_01174207 [Schizophyllum commune H4-8]